MYRYRYLCFNNDVTIYYIDLYKQNILTKYFYKLYNKFESIYDFNDINNIKIILIIVLKDLYNNYSFDYYSLNLFYKDIIQSEYIEYLYFGGTYEENIKNFINIISIINKLNDNILNIKQEDTNITLMINDDIILNYMKIYIRSKYTSDTKIIYGNKNEYFDFIKNFFTISPNLWKCKLIFTDNSNIEVNYDFFKKKHISFISYFILSLMSQYFNNKTIKEINYSFNIKNIIENHNKYDDYIEETINENDTKKIEELKELKNIIFNNNKEKEDDDINFGKISTIFNSLKNKKIYDKYIDIDILNEEKNNKDVFNFIKKNLVLIDTIFYLITTSTLKKYRIKFLDIINNDNIEIMLDFEKLNNLIKKKFNKLDITNLKFIKLIIIKYTNEVKNFFDITLNGNFPDITEAKGGNKYTLKELQQIALDNNIKITKIVIISINELHKKLKEKYIIMNKNIKLKDFIRILKENKIKINKKVNLNKQELIKKIMKLN